LVTGKINKQKGNEKQKPWFTKKCDKKDVILTKPGEIMA
jgi:hypothetical protein